MQIVDVGWLRSNLPFIGFVLVLAVVFLLFRTTQSGVDSLEELDAQLSRGEPTVIEFYSNV